MFVSVCIPMCIIIINVDKTWCQNNKYTYENYFYTTIKLFAWFWLIQLIVVIVVVVVFFIYVPTFNISVGSQRNVARKKNIKKTKLRH